MPAVLDRIEDIQDQAIEAVDSAQDRVLALNAKVAKAISPRLAQFAEGPSLTELPKLPLVGRLPKFEMPKFEMPKMDIIPEELAERMPKLPLADRLGSIELPELPEMPDFGDLPEPAEAVNNWFDFLSRMANANREFTLGMIQAWESAVAAPAEEAAPAKKTTAKKTTAKKTTAKKSTAKKATAKK